MKNKLCALLLAGLLLTLTGCQLAKPEQENELLGGDRFAGIYAVYDENGRPDFYSNPNLTELGTEEIDLGKYGTHSIPKEVLVGQYDEEERKYTFPGLEGFALLVTHEERDEGYCSASYSDMADNHFATAVTDQGNTEEMEGTLYIGPPLGAGPDWSEYEDLNGVWTCYRVYQTEDGTVYLDGSGNSYGGAGGMSTTATSTQKTTFNGEVTEETVSVKINVKSAPRLTRLTVTQFDESNLILQSQALPLSGELPEIDCLPTTAWVLVEEVSGTEVTRTVYNAPQPGEDPFYHQVILLDDSGMGYAAQLLIK